MWPRRDRHFDMERLQAAVDRAASRSRRLPSLGSALLAGRGSAYVRHRLRMLALTAPLRTARRLSKLWLVSALWFPDAFSGFLLLEGGASLLIAFTWGALEVTRERVRAALSERTPHRGRAAVELALARVLWLQPWLVIGAALAARSVTPASGGLHVLHLYALATALRVGTSSWVTAYQAGIQAVRRVRRPWSWVVAVELSEVAVLAVTVPAWGPWALPLAAICATLARQLVAIRLSRQAYGELPLLRPRASGVLRALWRPPRDRDALPSALRHGMGNLAGQLEPGLLLLLVHLGGRDPAAFRMALAVYALKPLLAVGFGWPRVFYLDLKRLECAALVLIRRRFERLLFRVSWWAALGSFAVLMAALYLAPGVSWVERGAWLPLLLTRSWVAMALVRAFSYGNPLRAWGIGVWVMVGMLALSAMRLPLWVTLVLLTAILASGALWGLRATPAPVPPASGLLSVSAFIHALLTHTGPVRLYAAQVDRRLTTARRAALGLLDPRDSSGPVNSRHNRGGPDRVVTRAGRATLLWFDTEPCTGASGSVAAGGCVHGQVDSGPCEHGALALQRLAERVELPVELRSALDDYGLPPPELARRFRERFAEGYVLDGMGGALPVSSSLARRLLAALLQGSLARGGRLRIEGFWVRAHAPYGPVLLRSASHTDLNRAQESDG